MSYRIKFEDIEKELVEEMAWWIYDNIKVRKERNNLNDEYLVLEINESIGLSEVWVKYSFSFNIRMSNAFEEYKETKDIQSIKDNSDLDLYNLQHHGNNFYDKMFNADLTKGKYYGRIIDVVAKFFDKLENKFQETIEFLEEEMYEEEAMNLKSLEDFTTDYLNTWLREIYYYKNEVY